MPKLRLYIVLASLTIPAGLVPLILILSGAKAMQPVNVDLRVQIWVCPVQVWPGII